MTVGRYSFLPWMRRGIANQLTAPAAAASRATLTVSLTVSPSERRRRCRRSQVRSIGPGDVLGINPQQIIRTRAARRGSPISSRTTSPSSSSTTRIFRGATRRRAADGGTHRLPPWLTLFVLKEGEFDAEPQAGPAAASVELHGDVDFDMLARRRLSSGPGRTCTSTRAIGGRHDARSRRSSTRCSGVDPEIGVLRG